MGAAPFVERLHRPARLLGGRPGEGAKVTHRRGIVALIGILLIGGGLFVPVGVQASAPAAITNFFTGNPPIVGMARGILPSRE